MIRLKGTINLGLILSAVVFLCACNGDNDESGLATHAQNRHILDCLDYMLKRYYREHGEYPKCLNELDSVAETSFKKGIENFLQYKDPESNRFEVWQYTRDSPGEFLARGNSYRIAGGSLKKLELRGTDGKSLSSYTQAEK